MSLLYQLSFTYIWNSQNITKLQLNMVIQCVYDKNYHTYYESINSASKLETLKCMNKVFGFGKYLSCYSDECHRIALSRFRCSAHKLMIEEGRYKILREICAFVSFVI